MSPIISFPRNTRRPLASTTPSILALQLLCGSLLLVPAACDGDGDGDGGTPATDGSSGGTDLPPSSSNATDAQGSTGDTTASSTSGSPSPTTSGDTTTSGGDDDSSTTDAPPQGTAVVVSLAHGGQTARSCDGGQTWGDFHEFGIQDDHSDYAAFGGLTFGNGAFVAATGWGAPAHILRSTDGVTWEDIADEAFVTARGFERPTTGASGVEFVGDDGFVLFAGANLWRSQDGGVWTAELPPTLAHSGHFREVEYLPGPGLLLLATEDYDAQGSWTIQVSDDGGATWQAGTGVTAGCGGYVQHVGGFAASAGRLLLGGGTGPTCVSDDDGRTWTEAGNVGAEIADVASYDGGFVVLAQSGAVSVSTDGQRWTPVGDAPLNGGRLAWDAELGFFGEGGAVYAHSWDGASWTTSPSQPPEGYMHVREFALGRLPSCR